MNYFKKLLEEGQDVWIIKNRTPTETEYRVIKAVCTQVTLQSWGYAYHIDKNKYSFYSNDNINSRLFLNEKDATHICEQKNAMLKKKQKLKEYEKKLNDELGITNHHYIK